MLKQISEQRRRVETEPHLHKVRRGWRGWLHWENLPWLEKLLTWFLKGTGLWKRGYANVMNVQPCQTELLIAGLPEAFDGFRLLWISDLHIEPLEGLVERVLELAEGLEYDICVLGGDYCFGHFMTDKAGEQMKRLAKKLVKQSDVYAIFGNHDYYPMAQILDATGVKVLLNEHITLERDGQSMALIGVDDCHYFGADDLDEAMRGLPGEAFKILLCHSPEMHKAAAAAGMNLYLAGHTHGGQVCLPNGFAPVTCSSVRRQYIKGPWRYQNMAGYTSRGAGASGVPVRFYCPGEIALLTLKRQPIGPQGE